VSESREVMNVRARRRNIWASPRIPVRYITEGEIPAFKLGNRWKLRKTILDRWMERKMSQATARRRLVWRGERERGRDMLGMGKKSRQLVGLDIGSSSIKAVELKATKAGYES